MADFFDDVTPDRDIDYSPDIDLEEGEELSDKEIDDILGKETRDNEGMGVVLESDAGEEEPGKTKTKKTSTNRRNFKDQKKKRKNYWEKPGNSEGNYWENSPNGSNENIWDNGSDSYRNDNLWDRGSVDVKEAEHNVWERGTQSDTNFWDRSADVSVSGYEEYEKAALFNRQGEEDPVKKNNTDDDGTASDSAFHHVHIITGDEQYLQDADGEPAELEGSNPSRSLDEIKDISWTESADVSKAIDGIRRGGENGKPFTFNSYAEPLVHNDTIDSLKKMADVKDEAAADSQYNHVKIQRPDYQTFSEPVGASATVRTGMCPGCGNPISLCNCNKDSKENKDNTKSGANESISDARKIHEQNAKAFHRMTNLENQYQSIAGIPGSAFSATSSTDTALEGVRELRNSGAYQTVRILLSNSGMDSVVKSMNEQDAKIASVLDKIDSSKASGALKITDFGDRKELAGKLAECGFNKMERHIVLQNRQFLQDKLTMREEMTKLVLSNRMSLSEDEFKFLNSKEFFSSNLTLKELAKDSGKEFTNLQGKLLEKYFKGQGVALPRNMDISKLKSKEIKRLVAGAHKHGFNDTNKRLLKAYGKAVRKREIGIKLQRFAKAKRLFKLAASKLIQGDETYGLAYNRMTSAIRKVKVVHKLAKVSAVAIGKVTGMSFLMNKIVKPAVMKKIVNPMSAKAAEAKNTVKKGLSAVKKGAVDKAKKTTVGKGVSKAKKGVDKVKGGVKNTAHKIGQKKAVKIAVKAGKYAGMGAKGTAKIVMLPFRIMGKIFDVFSKIKAAVIGFLGATIVKMVLVSCILMLIGMLCEGLGNFLTGICGTAASTATVMREAHESIIEYDKYKDMREDIEMMREWDKDVYKEAKKYGEGPVEEPYNHVHYGHTITHYGSPDKERGYTIHYVDQYGNELPSQSSNIKDVESLCIAMIENNLGGFKNYKKDLKNFDKLLEDMYGMMVYHDEETGLPFTYEISEVYSCCEGCEEYTYYCDDESYYDEMDAMRADQVAFYGDIEPLSEGCESREVEVDGYYNEWGDFYDLSTGLYDDIDFENNPYMVEGTGSHTEYYCPGHTVPVCYGHRDIDIYITLYDLDYAFENNLYPEDWSSRPYKKMVKDFVKKGGWKDWWQKIARNFKGGDWWELYGIDAEEGSAGFATENILTDEEIQKILDLYDGDISAAREALIQCALDAVGKIPYYWGGKSTIPGLEDNNFGSIVSPDAKGRNKKGLDCSGFVQWVYSTALGVKIPGSTAGYCSAQNKISYSELKPGDVGLIAEPGTSTNHIGIYAGKNAEGQDTWIHCTGAPRNTVVYGTYSFKYFYDPLGN